MAKKVVSSKKSVSYESSLEEFFVKKLPSLPVGIKEFLVNIGPWIDLVVIILMLPAILAVFGLGTMMAPFGYMMGAKWGYGYSLVWLFSLIGFGLSAWALPGLFKRQIFSWRLLFYSAIVSAVGSLLSGELVSMIIGLGISLYILYQIKSYYK